MRLINDCHELNPISRPSVSRHTQVRFHCCRVLEPVLEQDEDCQCAKHARSVACAKRLLYRIVWDQEDCLISFEHGSFLYGGTPPSATSTNLGLREPQSSCSKWSTSSAISRHQSHLIVEDLQRCTISLSRTYRRQSPALIFMF